MAITLNGSSSVVTNSGAVYDGIQRGTAVSASGTSVDFTSIPSWVKRITVMFSGVSTNGSSNILLQIGSGSITSSGYVSGSVRVGAFTGNANSTNGFLITASIGASDLHYGSMIFTNLTGNSWTGFGIINQNGNTGNNTNSGAVTISGTLDRIRITTVNGTDTLDAGTINILYE